MSNRITPVPKTPEASSQSPSPITSRYNFRRKISFMDIGKVLQDKCRRSKKIPMIHDMVQAIKERVSILQEKFILTDTEEAKPLLANLLLDIKKLNVTDPNADVELAKINRSITDIFPKLQPKVLLGEGRVKAAYGEFLSKIEKEVSTPVTTQQHVYLLARKKKGLLGKISAIFHKVEMEKEFGEILLIKSKVPLKENLALEFEKDFSLGRYSLKTRKASSDLEKFIQNPSLTFQQRFLFGVQLFRGVNALHQAGYVHGDMKPANILVYPDLPAHEQLKISDFGSAREMNPNDKGILLGNSRFVPPEGRLSQKGEVYAAALILIRILEEAVLKEDIVPLQPNEKKTSSPDSEKMRGIEKFIVQNKSCPQKEKRGLLGIVRWFLWALGRAIAAPLTVDLKAAENETDRYIDALITRLETTGTISHELGAKLQTVLKGMMQSDHTKRLSAEQAAAQLEDIYNELIAQVPKKSPSH